MENREQQWDASQPSRKISFKKALKQWPDVPQDMPEGMEKFIRHGLLVHTAMILIHKGRMDQYEPAIPPQHIREYLRSADRGTLQGILLEALFCEFEKLDEDC